MAEANAQKSPALTKDSAAVDALVAAMTDAWNSGDAKAFSARFAEDGSFTNIFGMIH